MVLLYCQFSETNTMTHNSYYFSMRNNSSQNSIYDTYKQVIYKLVSHFPRNQARNFPQRNYFPTMILYCVEFGIIMQKTT